MRYSNTSEGTMKIVAVVPMKLNNRRLPGKNTRPFTNGGPLCSYVLNTLMKVKGIEGVYVYCSDPSVKDYLPEGVRYLPRPASLDTDSTSMLDVLESFSREVPADIYVQSHATAPFISKESVEKGLKAVMSGEYDSSLAVTKMQDFIWSDGKPFNYSLENIPRTQDLPELMVETSGFYIFRSEVITEKRRRIGDRPYFVEVSKAEAIDIDEKEDFDMADAWFNYLRMNRSSDDN